MPLVRLCRHGARRLGTTCPTCTTADSARRHQAAVTNGLHTPHWKTIRKQRLELAGNRCELRLDDRCTNTATTVHLHPDLDGDHSRATLALTRAACAHCHGVIDAPRATKGRAARKSLPPRRRPHPAIATFFRELA